MHYRVRLLRTNEPLLASRKFEVDEFNHGLYGTMVCMGLVRCDLRLNVEVIAQKNATSGTPTSEGSALRVSSNLRLYH
jgi:hypothetical protein